MRMKHLLTSQYHNLPTIYSNLLSKWRLFWRRQPALYYSFWALFSLYPKLYPCIALVIIPFLSWNKKHITVLLMGLLFFSASFIWHKNLYLVPDPFKTQNGKGILSLYEVRLDNHTFHPRWIIKGTLESFNTEDGTLMAKQLPMTLRLAQTSSLIRPMANQTYQVSGELKATEKGGYWIDHLQFEKLLEQKWALGEWRYRLKNALEQWIEKVILHKDASDLMVGLTTGEFNNADLNFSFSRFGLQHIMAISGFHFSIIALFLSFLLRLFLPKPQATLCMLFLLTSYFLFIGTKASILRAWTSIIVVLMGQLIGRQSVALNAIGIAFLFLILFDPTSLSSMGFLFSFLVTGSILLLYHPCEKWLSFFFKKRTFSNMIESSRLNQCGHILSSWIRQALALLLAVHLAAIPLCLYFFGKFPVLSLIYNLFFPLLISASLFLFIMGSLIFLLLPTIGLSVLSICSSYTHFTLSLAVNLPRSFDWIIRTPSFEKELLFGYFIVLFLVGVSYKDGSLDKEVAGDFFSR